MNRMLYWGIFAVAQGIGSVGVLTGSPHGNPMGLLVAAIFLFPGSVLGIVTLDKLGIQSGYTSILVSCLSYNVVCWYLAALVIAKVRSRKST